MTPQVQVTVYTHEPTCMCWSSGARGVGHGRAATEIANSRAQGGSGVKFNSGV